MPLLMAHLTGNINSSEAARAFVEAGNLAAFHTGLVLPNWLQRVAVLTGMKPGIIRKRRFPTSVHPFLRSHAVWELFRLACRGSSLLQRSGLGARYGTIHQAALRFDATVSRAVDRIAELEVVYAYMDVAEQTFLSARRRGCRTIYELPTPYWRFTGEIVSEEARLQPDWAMTLPGLETCDPVMLRRDRELQLADVVVVPSELVRDSLRLAPQFKGQVHVVPYGCPEPVESVKLQVQSSRDGRLRVLYVGSLNQGKGLAYLAEAMVGLEQKATLTVIGSRTNRQPCEVLDQFLGAHRHRTGLSNDEVLTEMRQHDVLVLPTLYEGLALVLLEAMASGMTVVTTPNSGLNGMIRDGGQGFLVPIRNATALRERLRQLAFDPALLSSMRLSALHWSQEHSWQRYRTQLRNVVEGIQPAT